MGMNLFSASRLFGNPDLGEAGLVLLEKLGISTV